MRRRFCKHIRLHVISCDILADADSGAVRAWKAIAMGGLPQGLRSRVVAISSTLAVSACSDMPWYRFAFHTSACFFESYFALPAQQRGCERGSLWALRIRHGMHITSSLQAKAFLP